MNELNVLPCIVGPECGKDHIVLDMKQGNELELKISHRMLMLRIDSEATLPSVASCQNETKDVCLQGINSLSINNQYAEFLLDVLNSLR